MTESLERVLYRLLHHRRFREDFLSGRLDELDLTPDEQLHLKSIDPGELRTLCNSICRDLLRGELEHGGGLRSTYPDLFAQLERAGHPALTVVQGFVESEEYEHVTGVPYGEPGISVEEAFFTYLSRSDWLTNVPHGALLLKHEFLTGLLSILVLNHEPNFQVRTELVRSNDVAKYSVQYYPESFVRTLTNRTLVADSFGTVLFMYAATGKQFVRGPIRLATALLLQYGRKQYPTVQAKLADEGTPMTDEALSELAEGLVRLGVIA